MYLSELSRDREKWGLVCLSEISAADQSLISVGLPFGKNRGMGLTRQYESIRMKTNQKEGYCIMPKTITLRLSDEDFRIFQVYAKAENRTLANAIETLALKQIEEELFADEFEMEEILGNKDLLGRLKAGSAEAKRLKGRFIE
jgi:hypothetical protein